MRSLFIYFIFSAFIYSSSIGQETFYAHIDDEKVYQGSFFKVEYQLSDARGQGFRAPDFKNFKVAAGPSRSFQTTIVNGKSNSFETYSYKLQALKQGDYEIPPATIVVNGKRIKSNPIRISVLEPLKQEDLLKDGPPSGEDCFIVAELNRDTGYSGQQIILDYRIFTKLNVERIDFRSMPEFTDFYQKGMILQNETVDQVEISGEVYSTKLVRRLALFPKRIGVYDIEPAQVLLSIPKAKRRGFFFDNYTTKYVQSNGLKLTVLPLPEKQPDNFSGLIGSYTMEAMPSKLKLTTDDALTVRMRIKGNGDQNRLSTKPLISSPELEAYDPKIIAHNNDQNQKKRNHFAVIEYLYTADKPGRYFVQPAFTYFDVDSNDFVTLKAREYNFNVTAGSGAGNLETEEQAYQYERLNEARVSYRNHWMKSISMKILWLLLVVIALGLIILQWYRARRKLNMPDKTTEELAIEQLTDLAERPTQEVAHRIEEILGDYYRKTLEIEESAWSTSSLEEKMLTKGIASDKVSRAINLLERCKFAAYAGLGNEQSQEWIQEAKDLIH